MGSGKKKRKDKGGAAGAPWEALAAATLAAFGGSVAKIIAEGAEHIFAQRNAAAAGGRSNGTAPQSPHAPPPPPPDLMSSILQMLDENVEKSVADVVAAGGAGLTPTLEALRVAREFGLVELDEKAGTVRLTQSGRRTVDAVSGGGPAVEREEEEKAEESESEAFPE